MCTRLAPWQSKRVTDIGKRLNALDWSAIERSMWEYGYAKTPPVLTPAAPLPPLVEALRERAYPPLAAIANQWQAALGDPDLFPADLAALLRRCRKHGQTKPTPLMLRYEAGGYNCLHQDLYGDVVFPLQLTCFLSRRSVDYEGGDFLLVEQRPRAQSRGESIATEQGEIVIFTTRHRPVEGTRGVYRAAMRHGVSRVTKGLRYTLGVIFHDAK